MRSTGEPWLIATAGEYRRGGFLREAFEVGTSGMAAGAPFDAEKLKRQAHGDFPGFSVFVSDFKAAASSWNASTLGPDDRTCVIAS